MATKVAPNGKADNGVGVNRIAHMGTENGAERRVTIKPANLQTVEFKIVGTAPLCLHAFSQKALIQMQETQEAGSTARTKRTRKARDFDADYEGAKYVSPEGWLGMPAGAFRSAMIDSCRLCGFKMTHAKLSVFVLADGIDAREFKPLVRIYGEPTKLIAPARNDNGSCDLRSRPIWSEWSINLRVRYDADQFTLEDVSNLLNRSGEQVGVGEGRHNSRDSNGCGWGTFRIASE